MNKSNAESSGVRFRNWRELFPENFAFGAKVPRLTYPAPPCLRLSLSSDGRPRRDHALGARGILRRSAKGEGKAAPGGGGGGCRGGLCGAARAFGFLSVCVPLYLYMLIHKCV